MHVRQAATRRPSYIAHGQLTSSTVGDLPWRHFYRATLYASEVYAVAGLLLEVKYRRQSHPLNIPSSFKIDE